MKVPDVVTSIQPWDGTDADLDRYLNDRHAVAVHLDEENLILGLRWSPSVCQTHEVMFPWLGAVSPRFHEAAQRNSARSL